MTDPEAWNALIAATREWVEHHMDQFERFKFRTPTGPVFVTITYAPDYPDSFDDIDSKEEA